MNNMMMNRRSRPIGITIIAIILAIGGIFAILSAFALLGTFGGSAIVLPLISGILDLVLAYGLWTLHPWAFWATAIIEALNLISAVVILATGVATASTIIAFVLALVVLIYLFADRNVRAAFRT